MVLTDRHIKTIPHLDMPLGVGIHGACLSYCGPLVETIFPILGVKMNLGQERPGWFLCSFLTLRSYQAMQSTLKDLESPTTGYNRLT